MKLLILFAVVTTVLAQYESSRARIFPWWHLDDNDEYSQRSNQRHPFPECLRSGKNSDYLKPSALQKRYQKAVYDEERSSNYEHYENKQKKYDAPMDYDVHNPSHGHEYRTSASAATKLTSEIMDILRCDFNGTDARRIDEFLSKFKISDNYCKFDDHINCHGKKHYRTITGICNNVEYPLYGSAQTAYGRILSAQYDDNISKPRRKSRAGGYLPSCRKITLALGTKPNFDRTFNNLFTIFGQYLSHDITLAMPVSDSSLAPVSSCTCSSKYDWNKCTVIPIAPDDPYLSGQKCMAFPASAQAFKDQYCSLGVKEQMNANTHFPDLSGLYGSTDRTAALLISVNGKLKSTRKTWAKYEFPPAQREGLSCVDGTNNKPCLAGGDSRLVENLLFTGIQSMFLRFHNMIADALHKYKPHWKDMEIYERTRQFNIDVFQLIVYGYWVPRLLALEYAVEYMNRVTGEGYKTYVKPVVYNEVATAALRCHTLVRDLFSRCNPDGKRIDQLWLDDISHKVKYAYDAENNGIDSFICGALYDYGFAHDGNFAHQIRDRLFETKDNYGHYWRNDLAAINICRCREHGMRSYNDYRAKCSYKRASTFSDFGDTINYDGIKMLERLYKSVDDVDLFVGLNLEDPLPGGIVGPTSSCLLAKQFGDLCVGDRFCVAHKYQYTPEEFYGHGVFALAVLLCNTVDIEKIPVIPFAPPSEYGNPLINCTDLKLDLSAEGVKQIIEETDDPDGAYIDVRKLYHHYSKHHKKHDIHKHMRFPN